MFGGNPPGGSPNGGGIIVLGVTGGILEEVAWGVELLEASSVTAGRWASTIRHPQWMLNGHYISTNFNVHVKLCVHS